MTTQRPHQTSTADDEEVTLVAPRFDDEETIVARRVVPLGEVVRDAPVAAIKADARAYTPRPRAPRRTWALALVFVSALAGGVLGGFGLYLFQNRAATRHADAPEQTNAPTNAPAAAQQPTPTAGVISEQPAAPSTSQDSGTRTDNSDAAPAADADAEQPKASGDGEQTGTPKRGKKGARDEEIERNERRAKHADADDQLSRAATTDSGDRAARRVDTTTIFDRPRRAERRDRTRPNSNADRLRRIFEGQPE